MENDKTMQLEEMNYHSPDFEIVEIEFEQNILQGGSGDTPNFDGEDY